MANHQLLNAEDHKDLRIITRRSAELGDAVMHAPVFPFEFRAVQAHYPILFHEDATSKDWSAVALMGFERGENLFLADDDWKEAYLPLTLERGPFLIGMQSEGKTVVHIDGDNPRLSTTDGEKLFDETGTNTAYLDRIAAVLQAIHEGVSEMRAFAAAMKDLDLLEDLTVDIELNDGSKNRLVGFSVLNEEKVLALPAEKLAGLQSHGFLMPMYMAMASLFQLRPLITRKNKTVEEF